MCDFVLISAYYLSLIRSWGVQKWLMVTLHADHADADSKHYVFGRMKDLRNLLAGSAGYDDEDE